MNKPEEKLRFPINKKEKKLIELIRKTEYGEVRVIVQNQEPVRVEEIKKSVIL